MIHPRTGNTLTTTSAQAAQIYLDALDRILGSESGAKELLDKSLEEDRGFALAMAARYMLAKDSNDPAAEDLLLNQISSAQRIGVGGSHVERMLIDLLEAKALDSLKVESHGGYKNSAYDTRR